MMTNVSRTLEDALQWIKQGWATQAYAKDSKGTAVDPRDMNAVAWCINGAIMKATDNVLERREAAVELRKLLPEKQRLSEFNDKQQTVEQIIELFQTTIKRLNETCE